MLFSWWRAGRLVAPFRALVACLLLVAFAFAGCTSRAAPEAKPTPPSHDGLQPISSGETNATKKVAKPSPATMNLSRDPVGIKDGGDLTQAASKDWSWHVAPGFTTFTVRLEIAGLQGSPQYVATGLKYELTGGDPVQTVQRDSGGTSIVSRGSQCLVCLDGSTVDGAAGQWHLSFSTEQSAASYTLQVTVTY
jgi:hypothetical protein